MGDFPRDMRFFGAAMSPRWGAGGHAREADKSCAQRGLWPILRRFKAIFPYIDHFSPYSDCIHFFLA